MAPFPPPSNSIALPFSQNVAVNTAYGAPAVPYSTNVRGTQKQDYPKTTHETLAEQFVNNRGAFVRRATKDKEYVEVITSVPEMEDEGSELAVEERAEQEDGESRSAEEENAVESAEGETAKQEQGVDESAIGNNTNGGLESTPGTSSAQLADTIHGGALLLILAGESIAERVRVSPALAALAAASILVPNVLTHF